MALLRTSCPSCSRRKHQPLNLQSLMHTLPGWLVTGGQDAEHPSWQCNGHITHVISFKPLPSLSEYHMPGETEAQSGAVTCTGTEQKKGKYWGSNATHALTGWRRGDGRGTHGNVVTPNTQTGECHHSKFRGYVKAQPLSARDH